MGPFAAGQVVLLAFPYSDLTRSKVRPAILVVAAGRGDWIACQITSNPYGDPRAVLLHQDDFSSGSLHHISFVRPLKLVTLHETLFLSVAGLVAQTKLQEIRTSIVYAMQQL